MTTASQPRQGQLFSALHNLADEIVTEKTAAARAKQAESPTPKDPGGYQGASSHPTTSIDNRGQEASEGARSSENTADVNADQGAPGVNKAPDAKPGQQDDVQLNIGTEQSATGEDPSVEDDYKGGKDDPGTTHPAATDNDSLDGHKYASANFDQLYSLNGQLANGILADLANGFGNQLTKQALDEAAGKGSGNLKPSAAGENTPAKPKTQMQGEAPGGGAPEKTAGAKPVPGTASGLEDMIKKAADAVRAGKVPANAPAAQNADLRAGYELADYLGLEKSAAQQVVGECIELTLNDGYKDADLFGSFLQQHMKTAMDEGGSEDHSKGGDGTSGANGSEGAGGESGGASGGGGGGGGGSLGDLLGGGSDPGGMMGGGPGGPGGDPMGGGGLSEEQALMELVAALDELGIPIEELAQAGPPPEGGGAPPMGGGAPPMGGGGPPMGGGGPPMGGDPMMGGAGGPPPMGEGMKLASAAKAFRRSGRYEFKQAAAGSPQRQLRNQMKGHILELLSYSK